MHQPPHSPPVDLERYPVGPKPDLHVSHEGSNRLRGKVAVVTGTHSRIGHAVAVAYAREGADVVIGYLSDHDEARATGDEVERSGQDCLMISGDLSSAQHCREVVTRAVRRFGRIDVLVHHADYQVSHNRLEEISDDEWERTFAANVSALFHLANAAVPYMWPGSSIIGGSSIASPMRVPALVPYAASQAAMHDLCLSLSHIFEPKKIRVDFVPPPDSTPGGPPGVPPQRAKELADDSAAGGSDPQDDLVETYVWLASNQGVGSS